MRNAAPVACVSGTADALPYAVVVDVERRRADRRATVSSSLLRRHAAMGVW